jgi:hypothetical protein
LGSNYSVKAPMPYFSSRQTGIERGAKVVADIACAVLLATCSVVFFGWLGGLVAVVVLEVCLLAVDWLVPNEDASGVAVR